MSSFLRCTPYPILRMAVAFVLCAMQLAHAASEEKLNYQQARKALGHAEPQRRIDKSAACQPP